MMNKPKIPKVPVEYFTESPNVQASLQKLRSVFNEGGRPLRVSDTLDQDGNQYVNLVQKGGGVLGVALVGYTYVLEQMGIRFLRLAGTSAGAINTAMLTVIGNKNEEKSTRVLDAIASLNFFDLVDGAPIARRMIRLFITHKNFFKRVKLLFMIVGGLLLLLLASSLFSLAFAGKFDGLLKLSDTLLTILLVAIILLAEGIRYVTRLLRKFKSAGYGINPGKFFYNWLRAQMEANQVNTIGDLKDKAGQEIPGLHLRCPHPEGLKGLKGDVTFIASELVTQNKIEFPGMSGLFRRPEHIDELHPADFVRASMSIPFFFESWFIKDIPCEDGEIRQLWQETLGESDPPTMARFVDGGILSNFPISIFYNPKVFEPRIPTFGIDLNDTSPEDRDKNAKHWTMMGYFGRIFNTIRNYYDKDFQIKNRVYSKGIGSIPLSDFNWLNFFLTNEEKRTMFERGAEAAAEFLIGFDWNKYKYDRSVLQSTLEGNVG